MFGTVAQIKDSWNDPRGVMETSGSATKADEKDAPPA